MSTNFTKADIQTAVHQVTDGHLTPAQQKTTFEAIWTEAKKKSGGVTFTDIFKTTIGGFIADTTTVDTFAAALPTALTAARKARLDTVGTARVPNPVAEKKAALERAIQDVTAARDDTKKSADEADKDADAARKDAEAAEKAAEAAEKVFPGSSQAGSARSATTRADQAATDARTAADNATTQFAGVDGEQLNVENIIALNGNVADAEISVGNGKAAQRLAKRLAETANTQAKLVKRGREDAEKALKEAEEAKAKTFADKVKRWLKSHLSIWAIPQAILFLAIPVLLLNTSATGEVLLWVIWIAVGGYANVRFAPKEALIADLVILVVIAVYVFTAQDAGPDITVIVNKKLPEELTPMPTLNPVLPTAIATP